jgi:hypothetical protein
LFDAELLKQFTTLVAALKYQAIYLLDTMHPQNRYHSALSIALSQWLLYMLPLYIALLEHITEGCCAVQFTELLLPQNEAEGYIIRLIAMIVRGVSASLVCVELFYLFLLICYCEYTITN